MWQKCPICNGTGISPIPDGINTTSQCPTCLGARIISEISGLPPVQYQGKVNISRGNSTSTTSAHQFELDEYNSSSATKCKICGLEKWQHPQISFT